MFIFKSKPTQPFHIRTLDCLPKALWPAKASLLWLMEKEQMYVP